MKMKKELMKRVAAAGLAVSMVAGLTACGPTGKPEETKKEETKATGIKLPLTKQVLLFLQAGMS